MATRPTVGTVLLIDHNGSPTEWTVQQSGLDDMTHLLEIFESSRALCRQELDAGGTLYLFDADRKLLREIRGGGMGRV